MFYRTAVDWTTLVIVASALALCQAAAEQGSLSCATVEDLGSLSSPRILSNRTHTFVCGNGTTPFDPDAFKATNVSYNTTRRLELRGVLLPDSLPADWSKFTALRSLTINCRGTGDSGRSNTSTSGGSGSGNGAADGGNSTAQVLFGSGPQLTSLRSFISRTRSLDVLNINNCGMQGEYSGLWSTFLRGVRNVNLSGNALTGDFTSIDNFDECSDYFTGTDYDDPDCTNPDRRFLDVSSNALHGPISTGAALGDDITDALCSSGCLSLVLEPGVTNPQVLCHAPLVIYALNNPGLRYRRGTRFASAYVTGYRSNWCFEPASRWVLPTMWGVFLALMAGTLAVTLYARVRLKRVPFRMKTSAFDVLPRSGSSADSVASPRAQRANGSTLLNGAEAAGYVGLNGGGKALEMTELEAMIPKAASISNGNGHANGTSNGAVQQTPASFISVTAAALPVSTSPGSGPQSARSEGGGVGGGVGRVSWSALNRALGRSRRDPNGVRVALTEGMASSSSIAPDPVADLERELYDVTDLSSPNGGGGGGGATLDSRAAAAAVRDSGGGGSAAAAAGGNGGERTWLSVCRAVVMWLLDVLWMQLRTLLVLGMFGLECYWAYSLILYRGGWQLLVLIPNYLENTLGGIAMLRAFMAGTHGRWKYVAPVPMLPFLMASLYLVWGFVAYPFGCANLGPVSWEKFIDLMDSCGVLSSICWSIFSSLAYWRGNSVSTSYQYFNTDIFVGMLLMCFTDLLSTAHHLASTLQVPFKQWLRKELDVRLIKVEPDKSHRLQGDGDL